MVATSYKASGTQANVDQAGSVAWANPTRAASSNDLYAQTGTLNNTDSDWLRLTNFGFTSSDIPTGSTIVGIEMNVERRRTGSGVIEDSQIYLRTTSGQVGSNKADIGTAWSGTDEVKAYGGASDMWGTSLTYSDIVSNSDFGVDIVCIETSFVNATGAIDYVEIRINYTPPIPVKGKNAVVQAVMRAATR